jgi:hypothetical protein
VTDGTVDTVGPGYFPTLCRGTGTCIDLDGSTSNAGVLSMTLSLLAGVEYTAWYDLAGSNRSGSEIVDVSFGASTATHTLASADAYTSCQWQLPAELRQSRRQQRRGHSRRRFRVRRAGTLDDGPGRGRAARRGRHGAAPAAVSSGRPYLGISEHPDA